MKRTSSPATPVAALEKECGEKDDNKADALLPVLVAKREPRLFPNIFLSARLLLSQVQLATMKEWVCN